MLPCVYSVMDHRWDQNAPQTKVVHKMQLSLSLMFLPRFDVICDLLLCRPTATWKIFVLYNTGLEQKKCYWWCHPYVCPPIDHKFEPIKMNAWCSTLYKYTYNMSWSPKFWLCFTCLLRCYRLNSSGQSRLHRAHAWLSLSEY